MNQEQQRIAIAEWEHKILGKVVRYDGELRFWSPSLNRHTASIADYPNDLNAMHEAEKKLKDEKETSYYNTLVDICCRYPGTNTYMATASQRSEALCRTLWPERFE